jgi:hypothetical protein
MGDTGPDSKGVARQTATRSDERAFFAALARALAPGTVLHNADDRAVQRHLAASGARFPNHHWGQGLPADVESAMDLVLTRLGGRRGDWPETDHSGHLDGFLTAEDFGPCLVEFDEEQHFSPYRLASLQILAPVLLPRFDVARYVEYCLDPVRFRRFWRKHRLPSELLRPGQAPPQSPLEFAGTMLRRVRPDPSTRYYAPVRGFPFVGGRIAQRAYYDALRDCYHLTEEGRRLGLRPAIRVAKYQLVAMLGREIAAAPSDELDAAVGRAIRAQNAAAVARKTP